MQHSMTPSWPRAGLAMAAALAGFFASWSALAPGPAYASSLPTPGAPSAPLSISQVPLFLSGTAKPNVMLVLANSNSMDEDPAGLAVGSAAPNSKSEIARRVSRSLVTNYTNMINMGLMAFQQTTGGGDPVTLMQVHNSPYDVSFDPGAWDAGYTGPRDAPTKKFRSPKPGAPGEFLYWNVNLPFYAGSNLGSSMCYSTTADAFNNGEVLWSGPWDTYRCFAGKMGGSNALPAWGNAASEAAQGWSGLQYVFSFYPTDSDLGQGITDFGRFLAWSYASPAWFSNGSPGRGYVHVPVGLLDSTRAAAMNIKLGTSQFVVNGPNNPTLPLQNAGLTPLEGTLKTARDYFRGTLTNPAEGGPLAMPSESCDKDFVVIVTNGLPSVDANGVPSSNVTQMLADATAAAAALEADGVLTYIVGFALPFGVNPAQLDTIAAAGGTTTSYYATDEAQLVAKLDEVFADILRRSGAAASVALNSSSVGSGTRLYQAKFDAGWAGRLLAYDVDAATGALGASPVWDAGIELAAQDWSTGRKIITYKKSSGTGIPFRWPASPSSPGATELDVAQSSALGTDASGMADTRGAARLEFLRGNRALEGSNAATQFRVRTGALGDIVNSSPVYVGAPTQNPRDQSYFTFRTQPSVAGRTPVIYVGANDGMLHGFRASDGRQVLSYVPNALYAQLPKLSGQGYAHRYFVDASPNVQDAKIGASAPYWRSMLVSGLGGGGRAVFALDVTDPAAFSEANASQIVKWELSSADDADLGYTYGSPAIVRMNNGEWAAVFGNGYNNTGTGKAILYVVNLATGAVIRKITTGVGSPAAPNGIGPITVVDTDTNGTADYVYAGDLGGNMWKFDLTDVLSSNWGSAYMNGASPVPLFVARLSGVIQPITTSPEVTPHPTSGMMVLFGTGKYLETLDPASTATSTLYGIWDNGVAIADSNDLLVQNVTSTASIGASSYRTVSQNPIDWASHDGWMLNLPDAGERVAVDPILRDGRFIAVSLRPNTNPCSAGGSSWITELDYRSGGQLTEAPFDTNGDGSVNSADAITAAVAVDGISSSASVLGGFGTAQAPTEQKLLNLSTGAIASVRERSSALGNRRMSWREEVQ